MLRNLRELYQYRALLLSLVQRELKARYRNSVLGFLWTFLNPTLQMIVYSVVFRRNVGQGVEDYTYFLFVALLPWIWFSSSVGGGASSVSDRRDLLTKVAFPAQVLPASVIVTNLANFLLSLPLVLILGLIYDQLPTWHAVLLPVVIFVHLIGTLALVYLFAALNVRFRDLQQILQNILMLWFFATPIFYPPTAYPEQDRELFILANPMATLVGAYRAVLYEHRLPDLMPLAVWCAVAVVLLAISARIFERRREEFAEVI